MCHPTIRPTTPESHLPRRGTRAQPDHRPAERLNVVTVIHGRVGAAGNWICPTAHTTIAVMGGNVVDLRDALLESGHITITAVTLMGGIEIIVPEGVRVICDGMGLLGGFGSETHKSVTIHPSDLPGDAPLVRVRGLAVMGGVSVVTRARG